MLSEAHFATLNAHAHCTLALRRRRLPLVGADMLLVFVQRFLSRTLNMSTTVNSNGATTVIVSGGKNVRSQ